MALDLTPLPISPNMLTLGEKLVILQSRAFVSLPTAKKAMAGLPVRGIAGQRAALVIRELRLRGTDSDPR